MDNNIALSVNQLTLNINLQNATIYAIDNVSFQLKKGKTLAIVGESGCGKSMTALSIMQLLPPNSLISEHSSIFLGNTNLCELSEKELWSIRGQKIGMIFQDPMMALNPVLTIEQQLKEVLLKVESKLEMQERLIQILQRVRIPSPEHILLSYPHQLSGGMKQRIMIAMALAFEPDVLIADEPTTALDVSTAAQVLALINELRVQMNTAVLLITHDLGVVSKMADEVAVMYAGHIVEFDTTKAFFKGPKHPYSQKLLEALPENTHRLKLINTLKGTVPTLDKVFKICKFYNRCDKALVACETKMPKLSKMLSPKASDSVHLTSESTQIRCLLYEDNIPQNKATHFVDDLKPNDDKILNSDSEGALSSKSLFSLTKNQTENQAPLLSCNNLQVNYPLRKGILKRVYHTLQVVNNLSLDLYPYQTLCLLGESGCGKTTAGKAIMQLINDAIINPNAITYHFLGKSTPLSRQELKKLRYQLQFVFQDPFSSMNPKFRIKDLLQEGMVALNIGSKDERHLKMCKTLALVGLDDSVLNRYPHEFSGGQRQRLCIARALCLEPKVLILDEPTSALDVCVQAQVLNLLKTLQANTGLSYLFITHNMGVVNTMADTIKVMYLGKIIEEGPADQIMSEPKHPYTQVLMDSVLKIDSNLKIQNITDVEIPSLLNPPSGCHFAPRCPFAMDRCLQSYPPFFNVTSTTENYMNTRTEAGGGANIRSVNASIPHMTRCYLYETQ